MQCSFFLGQNIKNSIREIDMSVTDAFFSSHAISRKLIQPLLAEIATGEMCGKSLCALFSPILSCTLYPIFTAQWAQRTNPKGWPVGGGKKRRGANYRFPPNSPPPLFSLRVCSHEITFKSLSLQRFRRKGRGGYQGLATEGNIFLAQKPKTCYSSAEMKTFPPK